MHTASKDLFQWPKGPLTKQSHFKSTISNWISSGLTVIEHVPWSLNRNSSSSSVLGNHFSAALEVKKIVLIFVWRFVWSLLLSSISSWDIHRQKVCARYFWHDILCIYFPCQGQEEQVCCNFGMRKESVFLPQITAINCQNLIGYIASIDRLYNRLFGSLKNQ